MPFVVWPMSFAMIIALILLLSAFTDARAQELVSPSRVALNGVYWFGAPLTFDRQSPILRHFNTNGVGISKDHSLGAALDLAWDLSPMLQIHFQGGLRFGSGDFRSNSFARTDSGITRTYDFVIKTDYTAVDLGLAVSYQLFPWIEALGGATLSFYPSSSAVQIRSSVDGLSPQIIDTAARGDTLLSRSVHVSVPIGLRLALAQGSSYSAGVDLMAGINITEAIRGYVSQSIRVGAGVWVALGRSRPNESPSVAGSPVPVLPRLQSSARFLVNGRDADSVSVIMIDTTTTSSIAIPQYIYFDALSDLEDAFSVITDRLRERPDAKLSIDLRRGAAEAPSSIMERVHFLSQRFSVTDKRLSIDTLQAPVTGPGYAILRSSDPSIFLPLRTKATDRVARVDQLNVERTVIAEGGVDRWSVAVLNNADTIVSYGSSTPGTNEADGFSFSIPASASRLLLHSFVRDRAGQRADSYDTLYVRTASELPRQVEVAEYVLLNQPQVPGQAWSYETAMIDLIVGSIDNESLIEVTNLADNGVRYVAEVVSRIMTGASARGVLPRKIEALPKLSGGSTSQAHAYSKAVRVRVISAR